jgi:hypothetical protein
LAGCPTTTAHVAQRAVGTEIEAFSEGLEVWAGDTAHRGGELLDGCGALVELVEHWAASLFGLVLWRSGAQGLFQVAPEAKRSVVVQLEEPADVSVPAPDQAVGGCARVRVPRSRAVAIPGENAQCDQGVREVGDGARMQPEPLANLTSGQRRILQLVEEAQLHRHEQDLRVHEGVAERDDLGG